MKLDERTQRKIEKFKNAPLHKKIKRYCVYLALSGFIHGLKFFPLPLCRKLGKYLASTFYLLDKKNKTRALNNLNELNMPSSIAKESYRHFGEITCEAVKTYHLNKNKLKTLVEASESYALFKKELNKKRGLIILTGHFGNFELVASHMAQYFPLNTIANMAIDPRMNQLIYKLRTKHGLKVWPQNTDSKTISNCLKNNEAFGFLVDMDLSWTSGVFVSFFGKPCYTIVAPSLLALRTGSPLGVGFCLRVKNKYQGFAEMVDIEKTDNLRRDIVVNTQKWSFVFEKYIRQYPEQWLWMQERWKTKPRDKPAVYEESKKYLKEIGVTI